MDVLFQVAPPARWSVSTLIAFVRDPRNGKDPVAPDGGLTPSSRRFFSPDGVCPALREAAPWLADNPALADVSGAADEVWVMYGGPRAEVSRVLLAGLGRPGEAETGDLLADAVRRAAGAAARRCRELGLVEMGVVIPVLEETEPSGLPRLVEETVCGVLLGLYRQTEWKTRLPSDPPELPDPLRLVLLAAEEVSEPVREAARRGQAAAEAVILARNLINGPANQVTPAYMAAEARRVARRRHQRCEVLEPDQLEGMGAFRAVAAGSAAEAQLIVLEHAPEGHEEENPLVVVGKGLTFDSGGISLKPAAGMEAMKGDMSGAAAVLGLFDALGALGVPRRVVGILPCTENMPGGRACRPGDVVTTLSGRTVEIVNTDAEGRLVLCDALTYAQQRWTPSLLLDAATLTGACVVALGGEVAGLFASSPELAERIQKAGRAVGEAYWPLPLEQRYFEALKSETADFANAGSREGGACSAAIFLKQFIREGVPWAHLDIAGPAFAKQKSARRPAGASGFAVRTFLELAFRDVEAALQAKRPDGAE